MRNRPAGSWSLLIAIIAAVFGITLAQTPEARRAAGWDLKGSIGFEKSYTPQKGDQEFLKGVPLVLKDKKTGAVLGRTATEADGKFIFSNLTGAGGNPMMNAKQVCNEKGDCFDFRELKPDDPPPLEPIIVDDPPLKEWKRVNRPKPRLVLGTIVCAPQGGGAAIILKAVKSESPVKKSTE